MKRRFHWFAYYASPWEMKESFRKGVFDVSRVLHQTRDAMAFAELSLNLSSIGYFYVGPILNLPTDIFENSVAPEPIVDLHRGDLIVQVMRPPLNEERISQIIGKGTPKQHERFVGRVISRSELDLERAVATALKRHFLAHCSRDAVDLKNELKTDLGAALSANTRLNRYVSVDFRPNNSACYKRSWCIEHKLEPAYRGCTAGYVAFIPGLPKPFAGVSALIAWGQAGFETLFLTWVLRHTFTNMIQRILRSRKQFHFVMAEWTVPKLHARPTSLHAFQEAQSELRILFHATRSTAPRSAWKIRTEF
jgi:hypothetical protein